MERTTEMLVKEMNEEFVRLCQENRAIPDEGIAFEKWLDELNRSLMGTLSEHLRKLPDSDRDHGGEAILTALAKFTCHTLAMMEEAGFVKKGIDLFVVFTEAVLPTCRKVERRRTTIDNKVAQITKALFEGKMTDEQIFDELIQEGDEEEALRKLAEAREMITH